MRNARMQKSMKRRSWKRSRIIDYDYVMCLGLTILGLTGHAEQVLPMEDA